MSSTWKCIGACDGFRKSQILSSFTIFAGKSFVGYNIKNRNGIKYIKNY